MSQPGLRPFFRWLLGIGVILLGIGQIILGIALLLHIQAHAP